MANVKLELLRHGSSHNQLLSPLTAYLAICDNEPVSSFQVPYTHSEMHRILRALSYQLDETERLETLAQTGRQLGALLGTVPGLVSALGDRQDAQRHLRLVLSASELALIPFELAFVPAALSSASKPMLLRQSLSMTRESRRRAVRVFNPNAEMRILFAFAAPTAAVPALAHGQVLKKLVEPWLDGDQKRHYDKRVRFLPNATAASLLQLCAEEAFSHVHILAHGATIVAGMDQRFGLALHHEKEEHDVIDGARLASVLLAGASKSSLQVVTISSCDSGQQGGVIGVGSSVAQELHEAGIPMVIASQFPLSVVASVDMVQKIYSGALWGEDPRQTVAELREVLHAKYSNTHDWGSIVQYLSSDVSLDAQVFTARVSAAMAAVYSAKQAVDDMPDEGPSDRAHAMLERLLHARSRLQNLLDETIERNDSKQEARILRRLGSTDNHVAGLQLKLKDLQSAKQSLMRARLQFWQAYRKQKDRHWALLLYLSMHLVADKLGWSVASEHSGDSIDDLIERLEMAAKLQALAQTEDRAWAHADLIEIAFIKTMHRNEKFDVSDSIAALKECAAEHPYPVFAARRQALRYRDLYAKLYQGEGSNPFEVTLELAERIDKELPDIERPYRDY